MSKHGFPRHAGQLPLTYDLSAMRADWTNGNLKIRKYVDMDGGPLYPFGHGLSYTTFEYRNLGIAPQQFSASGTLDEVRNTGARDGAETVQLYVRDLVASVTRPLHWWGASAQDIRARGRFEIRQ